jgi:hypothetical protein
MAEDSPEFQRPITGAFTAVSQAVDITGPDQSTEIVQIQGTWVGTLVVEGCNDGATYSPVILLNLSTGLPVVNITANGRYLVQSNSNEFLQVRASAWTSGTANLFSFGSDSASLINTFSLLRGASDGTLIGNALDRLKVIDGLRQGGTQGVLSMPTANTAYEAKVGASRLANRKSLTITALTNMYWGYNNTVTTTTGTQLIKGQQIIFAIDMDSTFQVWLVSGTAAGQAQITESP